MSGSLLKEFVVEKTTNILPNLLFKNSTFLEEPSTTSLRDVEFQERINLIMQFEAHRANMWASIS
jgi:CRISPR/Cas system-associated endonuclease Cas1